MVVHETFRNAILAGDADAIQVEWNARENRIGTCPEAGACPSWAAGRCGVCRTADRAAVVKRSRVCRIIETRIEVAHTVVCFISVGNSVPAQPEIERQTLGCAPVVLDVGSPGDVVPKTMILDGQFVI